MAYQTPSKNILDKHMREGIHTFLHGTVMKEPGSMRIDELAFTAGKKEGRLDIVVVNSLLHGYEIKSDGDTNGLERLSRIQIKLYSQIMDRLSVIVTPKHVTSVKRRVPEAWGIYMYSNGLWGSIVPIREPQQNELIQPRAVAGLLWKDRALQLLSDNGLGRGFARKAKSHLHDHIAEWVDFEHIREAVRLQFKSHRRSV